MAQEKETEKEIENANKAEEKWTTVKKALALLYQAYVAEEGHQAEVDALMVAYDAWAWH